MEEGIYAYKRIPREIFPLSSIASQRQLLSTREKEGKDDMTSFFQADFGASYLSHFKPLIKRRKCGYLLFIVFCSFALILSRILNVIRYPSCKIDT